MQFMDFRNKKGSFASSLAACNAKAMSGWQWWKRYGYGLLELQYVAVRVLV
jgi:hypothetical protein